MAKAATTRAASGAAPKAAKGRATGGRKGGRGAARPGWRARLLGGGPSWIGVAVLVLAVLVILPIAAAVLGDIWALLLATLVGGFAIGRATGRR